VVLDRLFVSKLRRWPDKDMVKKYIILYAMFLVVLPWGSAFSQDQGEHLHHNLGNDADIASINNFHGIKASFELLDRNGETVTEESFLGQYVLLAFGFTHCEQICPLMVFNMASVLEATERDAVGIFVSVDTERDTPMVTDDYASAFGGRMIGLGGDYGQVNIAASNFKLSYAVTKTQSNYTVQHTANIYLIGPNGDLQNIFAVNTPPEEILLTIL